MLERIKHLFDISDVVFVISTHTDQLSHSIKAVYGNEFDAKHYLSRFFMRSYTLATPSNQEFIKLLLDHNLVDGSRFFPATEVPGWADFLSEFSVYGNFGLRDIQRVFDILTAISFDWAPTKPRLDPIVLIAFAFAHVKGVEIEMARYEDNEWLVRKTKGFTMDTGYRGVTFSLEAYLKRRFVAARLSREGIKGKNQFVNEQMDYIRADEDFMLLLDEEDSYMNNYMQNNEFGLIKSYPDIIRKAGRFNPLDP